MKGFTTRAVHAPPLRRDGHGSLRPPIYDNVAFEFESSRDLQKAFEGRKPAHVYSRISNPTVEEFEQRVLHLSGGLGAIAVSSGMAAITNVVMALAEAGTNIVTSRHLFGNTVSLFESTLGSWGLETRYADLTDPDSVEGLIDDKTRAVFAETITNPQLEVVDVAGLAGIAKSHGVPLILDGTLTTPYLFDAKSHGVSIEVISSTKYMSGGATSVGGLIIDYGSFDWGTNPKLVKEAELAGPNALLAKLRREVHRNSGSCLSPHNAWLQTLGLETMAMRIDRSCDNALRLAQFLSQHRSVVSANYPGLEGHPNRAVASKQFGGRFGGLLTFELQSKEECFRFMDSLQLVRRATNLNDNKTLILHPASTIFCEFSEEQRAAMGVGESLMRVAAGIEDTEDLLDDITRGLDKA